ncbi:MAG: myo-inosose-2 dehydratase [Ruminococcaceae bacterium]|nr:myo-inosose-2 dehydratase [Oscillospiraceae bacterium]
MFSGKNVKLGIAPIAWTNDDLPELGGENTFQQCVSEMALAGFTGSEVGNKYPRDPAVLKPMLDLRGIEICNAWFSTFLISKPYEETAAEFEKHVAFLAAMGAKVVGVSEQSHSTQGIQTQPVFEGKYEMNDAEWAALCDGLNRLGRLSLEKYGVALTFHHHMGTVVQSAAETDRLMAGTDPKYVSLLFDSGHFAYCGEDPAALVKRYAKRIRHVHLKDIRPDVVAAVRENRWSFLEGVRQGAFTIPGDGCVDFDPIFKTLAETGYEGYMVVEAEQDPAKANPLEYAIRARTFIREHTGL